VSLEILTDQIQSKALEEMNRIVWLIILSFCGSISIAQTSPCPAPEHLSSKASKLFEKALEKKKKRTTIDRIELLREVIDIQDDWANAHEELGRNLFKLAKRDTEYIGECVNAIHKWMELCENYSCDAHYLLGAAALMRGENKLVIREFELFIEKSNDNDNGSIQRKRLEVESLLPRVQFELAFYANEDAYIPEPLPLVSLPSDEYLPALSPDGRILFFTRVKTRKARGDLITKRSEDLVWSRRRAAGEDFDEGEVLEYPFNVGDNYGGVSLSIDNKTLIIAASNPTSKNPRNIDLFMTTYVVNCRDGKGGFLYYWDDLTLLGDAVNTSQGWEAQPALSPDGRELFFASARETSTLDSDGNPTMDLFVSTKDSLGSWTQAIKLPAHISTSFQEKAPFLHPDGKTLYFSSNRTPSGGGYDLWMTRRDSMGVWSEVVNLGRPVNSSGDEHGLVVSAQGDEAFFASSRPGTQGLDILSFTVPESLRPESVKVIQGKVDPAPPEENVVITVNYIQSKEAEEIEINLEDGSFAAVINLERNEDVVIKVEGDGIAFEAVVVNLKKEEDKVKSSGDPTPIIELRAHKFSQGSVFELQDVYFSTNSSTMSRAAMIILTEFADYLSKNPELQIRIEGHTDNIGEAGDNLSLSNDRASSVAKHLVYRGVRAERLIALGLGQNYPKATNNTPEGRAINRRTEFSVFK
jgi:outer membrane protein OmpA-like peptidoglycan-associated protein/Tol biopolymer transport system component